MMPEPMPTAVPPPSPPPKGKPRPFPPPVVAIWDVSVRTESLTWATTPLMSSCVTDAVPAVADGFCAVTFAFAEAAGVVPVPCGIESSTTARVEPVARMAARRAVPSTVPYVRRPRGATEGGAGAEGGDVRAAGAVAGDAIVARSQPLDGCHDEPGRGLQLGVWSFWLGVGWKGSRGFIREALRSGAVSR